MSTEARLTEHHLDDDHGLSTTDSLDTTLFPVTTPASREEPDGMSCGQAFNLYTSHFLSTWNIRTYEFAAVSLYM